jgi:cytochrome c2
MDSLAPVRSWVLAVAALVLVFGPAGVASGQTTSTQDGSAQDGSAQDGSAQDRNAQDRNAQDRNAKPGGDPARGREVFRTACQPCHDAEPGSHQVGPSLYAVVGRKVGTADGYRRYSAALKQADGAWTPERLERYLSDPKAMFPNQRKRYDGLKSRHDRVDLIAYLRQLNGR